MQNLTQTLICPRDFPKILENIEFIYANLRSSLYKLACVNVSRAFNQALFIPIHTGVARTILPRIYTDVFALSNGGLREKKTIRVNRANEKLNFIKYSTKLHDLNESRHVSRVFIITQKTYNVQKSVRHTHEEQDIPTECS